MCKKIFRFYSFFFVICFVGTIFCTCDVFSAGWSATGTNSSSGSGYSGSGSGDCSTVDYHYRADCSGLSWLYYEAVGPEGTITLPYPEGASTMEANADVSYLCSNDGKGGFWSYGYNGFEVGYYEVDLIDPGRGQQLGVINVPPPFDDDTYYFDGHWAPAAYGGNLVTNFPQDTTPVDSRIAQRIGNYVATKRGDYYEVLDAYNAYLQSEGKTQAEDLPNGLYAFCYWEGMEDVTLTVDSDDHSHVVVKRIDPETDKVIETIAESPFGKSNIITQSVHVGDKLQVEYEDSGCDKSSGNDFVIYEHTVDGTSRSSGYSWTVGDDTYVKVDTADQGKTLTAKYYTTTGTYLGNRVVKVCYGEPAEVTRPNLSPSLTFVGWKDTYNGAYLWDPEQSSSTTFWLGGSREGSTDPSKDRSYETYHYRSMKKDKTIYGIYAPTYEDKLLVSADLHSKAYAYRIESPDAHAPTMEAAGMEPSNCPSGSPCAYRDHVEDSGTPAKMTIYEGDVLAIAMDRDDCYHWATYNGKPYGHHVVGPLGAANLDTWGGNGDPKLKLISFGYYTVDGSTVVEARTAANNHQIIEQGYDITTGGRFKDGDGSNTELGCPTVSLDRTEVGGYKFLGWQYDPGQTSTDGMIENEEESLSPTEPYISNKESDIYYKNNTPMNIFRTINYYFKKGTDDEYDGVNKTYYAYYAKRYSLNVEADKFTHVTVKRHSSRYGERDVVLCDNVTGSGVGLANVCSREIYEGDELEITYTDSYCHPYEETGSSYTINIGNGDTDIRSSAGKSISSGNNVLNTSLTVGKSDVTVKGKSNILSYKLNVERAGGSGIQVERNVFGMSASPYGQDYGATSGDVYYQKNASSDNGSVTIYCGDNLKTTFSLMDHYSWGNYTDREAGNWGWQYTDFNQATFRSRTAHDVVAEQTITEQGPLAGDYDNKNKVFGVTGVYVDSANSNNEIVHTDVTAKTARVVRDEFQGRATVVETENDKRSDSTGWVETNTTARLDDVKCLNYDENGGCKVNYKLDLRTIDGTGSTAYSVYRVLNGSRAAVEIGVGTTHVFKQEGEKKVFEKTDTIYPGQELCYELVFAPYGSHGNNFLATVRACAKAEVSEFEGRTIVISDSGTTTNGYRNTSNASNARIVQNINDCPVTGCDVTFTHSLRRTKGIGWTNYEIQGVSNYPSKVTPGSSDGIEYFRTSDEVEEYRETLTLYPGTVVCETLKFKPENNYANISTRMITLTTCASALGSAQPNDPQDPDVVEPREPNDPDPTPVDPDGPIEDTFGGDDALLNILVKNNDVAKYNNYRKVVYAKPDDNVTYRATYNPKLQYTYTLKAEKLQIDDDVNVYPNGNNKKNTTFLYSFFNTTINSTNFNIGGLENWDNAFSVYSTNFRSASQFAHDYNSKNDKYPVTGKAKYLGGDTSFQEESNSHEVDSSEVGTSLVEFARTNWKDTPKNANGQKIMKEKVKTTPTQIKFSDDGSDYHFNKANVITTSLSRSAFVRVPYNFVINPSITDEKPTVNAGEVASTTISIEVASKKNCETVDESKCNNEDDWYATRADQVKYEVVVYDPDMVGGEKLLGGLLKDSSREADICSDYFGHANDEVGCGYADIVTGDFPDGMNEGINASFSVQDKDAGSKVCVAVAAFPATSGADTNWHDMNYDNTWRVSESKCYTIAKEPSFQSWGGNVFAAGGIDTSASAKKYVADYNHTEYKVNPTAGSSKYRVFGSWGELGVIAGGKINNMGSAATMGYASIGTDGKSSPDPFSVNTKVNTPDPGGFYSRSSSICLRSLLTFANVCSGNGSVGSIGSAGASSHAKSDKSAIVAKFSNVETENLGDFYADGNLGNFLNDISGMHYYEYKGNATIGSGILKKGTDTSNAATIFLKVDGNLTINGDIAYESGDYSLLKDIPKLIIYVHGDSGSNGKIINGNIMISCGVGRIDAMLVADGTVDTCSDGRKESDGKTPDRNRKEYSKQLKVNGAIISDRLVLNRTYGAASGANSIVPAEIINYDPTLYLWGSTQADMSNTGTLDVTYTLELSPRYGTEQ